MASLPNGTKVRISTSMVVDKNGLTIQRSKITDPNITWTIQNTITDNNIEYVIVTNNVDSTTYTVRSTGVEKDYTNTGMSEATKKLYKNGDPSQGFIDYVKLNSGVITNIYDGIIADDYRDDIWKIKAILNDNVTLENTNDSSLLTVRTDQVSQTTRPNPKNNNEILSDVVYTYSVNESKSDKPKVGSIIKIKNTSETDGTPISDHSRSINWTVTRINLDGSYLLNNDENANTITVSLVSGGYTIVGRTKEAEDAEKKSKEIINELFVKNDSNVSKGDLVMLDNLVDYNGSKLTNDKGSTVYKILQVGGSNLPDDRIVIGDSDGNAVAAVNKSNLKKLKDYDTLSTAQKISVSTQSIMNNVTTIYNLAKNFPTMSEDEYYEHDPGFTDPPSSNILKKLQYTALNGSAVQVLGDKLPATPNDEPPIEMSTKIKTSSNAFKYNTEYDSISNQLSNDVPNLTLRDDFAEKVARNDPEVVQNQYGFPVLKDFDSSLNMYKYDYGINYDNDMLDSMEIIRKNVNIDVTSRSELSKKYTTYYNRFKLLNPNDNLRKTFAHVFFVRPDLNIFVPGKPAATDIQLPELNEGIKQESEWFYASKHTPELLRQLTQSQAGYDHQFMMLLSNKSRSFDLSDEYIEYESYGRTLTGYEIVYGKNNIKSRTNKQFSITYYDDNLLHIYNIHKLWTNYISDVYRGKYYPKTEYIYNKIIDYATCVYYFLCDEDGETILFWSKYWGVFPNNAPSSPFGYSASNPGGVRNPELNIEYNYSFKEDFNPFTIIEFNTHGNMNNFNYVKPYNPESLSTGYTWVGAPFIETFNGDATSEIPYTYKLRFRPNNELSYNPSELGRTKSIN